MSATWRGRSITSAGMSNSLGHCEPFRTLSYALTAHDAELDAGAREAVLEASHELDVFPDVRPAVERLASAGYDLSVVSNGSPALLETVVDHAGIGEWILDTISADAVVASKVVPELYRHAVAGRERRSTRPPTSPPAGSTPVW